jgi:hypothetical protein
MLSCWEGGRHLARKVFFCFEYKKDCWRVAKVRGIGLIEGNPALADNEWESVAARGDAAIERWIAQQMAGRECLVLLIGATTDGRKWINYELKKAWASGLGVVGIHIHNLLDRELRKTTKGPNPMERVFVGPGMNPRRLSYLAQVYDPPHTQSAEVYAYVAEHIERWVEEAVRIRRRSG